MTENGDARLSAMLERWMRRQRVKTEHLVRHGAVSRNTVWRARHDQTERPTIDTIRRIARALATDPYDRSIDYVAYVRASRDLLGAAGYDPAEEETWIVGLELSISAFLGDPVRGQALARFLRENPDLTEAEIDALQRYVAVVLRGGRSPEDG